jgi:hypothetical protein
MWDKFLRAYTGSTTIIIIQFNSLFLCAESTAVKPITGTAQCTC